MPAARPQQRRPLQVIEATQNESEKNLQSEGSYPGSAEERVNGRVDAARQGVSLGDLSEDVWQQISMFSDSAIPLLGTHPKPTIRDLHKFKPQRCYCRSIYDNKKEATYISKMGDEPVIP